MPFTKDLNMPTRSVTFIAALFTETNIHAIVSHKTNTTHMLTSSTILWMSRWQFIRNYFRKPIWLQFLHLPICLNSAGTQSHYTVGKHRPSCVAQFAKKKQCNSACQVLLKHVICHHTNTAAKLNIYAALACILTIKQPCPRPMPQAGTHSDIQLFTKVCISQCTPQFTAPFIDIQTNTSITDANGTHNADANTANALCSQSQLCMCNCRPHLHSP